MENLQPQVAWSNPCSWGREHTALNGILGYFNALSFIFSPHLVTSQRNLFIFLCSSSHSSPKSFFLYSWSQKHPNLLPSHSSLTIISTCFPIFSSFKALIQTVFFLSLTCLHHHYFSYCQTCRCKSKIWFQYNYLNSFSSINADKYYNLIQKYDQEIIPGLLQPDGDRATQAQIQSSGKRSWHSHSKCH